MFSYFVLIGGVGVNFFGVEFDYCISFEWVVWVNGVVVCEFDYYDIFFVVEYLYFGDNILLIFVVV